MEKYNTDGEKVGISQELLKREFERTNQTKSTDSTEVNEENNETSKDKEEVFEKGNMQRETMHENVADKLNESNPLPLLDDEISNDEVEDAVNDEVENSNETRQYAYNVDSEEDKFFDLSKEAFSSENMSNGQQDNKESYTQENIANDNTNDKQDSQLIEEVKHQNKEIIKNESENKKVNTTKNYADESKQENFKQTEKVSNYNQETNVNQHENNNQNDDKKENSNRNSEDKVIIDETKEEVSFPGKRNKENNKFSNNTQKTETKQETKSSQKETKTKVQEKRNTEKELKNEKQSKENKEMQAEKPMREVNSPGERSTIDNKYIKTNQAVQDSKIKNVVEKDKSIPEEMNYNEHEIEENNINWEEEFSFDEFDNTSQDIKEEANIDLNDFYENLDDYLK